jgi:hypothetical protein
MMEKVRGALFSMLLCHSARGNRFPEGKRWLDLFAGTVRFLLLDTYPQLHGASLWVYVAC